jgi:hypothetical protein
MGSFGAKPTAAGHARPKFHPLNCYNRVLYCDYRFPLGAAHNNAKGESWL